jgi:nitrate/nitrite-specific signal transduction histidine kinase
MRAFSLRNLRAQTGLIFLAGLLALVVVTVVVSLAFGDSIRQDTARLGQLEAGASGEAAGALADGAETAAEIRARRDVNLGMVRGMYAALFLSSIVFLLIGLWLIQQIIVAPVEALDQMAQRIASGDLDTPATLGGSGEFQDLARSFEVMRLELREAAMRQTRWAEELELRVRERTQQLAEATEEVRAQAERVSVLQERERIGMELHDGLLQTLGYLYLKTDQAEGAAVAAGFRDLAHELSTHRDLLEQASQDVRQFIADLRELPPKSVSLGDALSHMIDELRRSPGLGQLPRVALEPSRPPHYLPADHVAHLVRIAREALLNAGQHGQATLLRICCQTKDGQGEMLVEDNGCGFVVDGPRRDDRPHFGLTVMAARAARIGGELTLRSIEDEGTTVLVRWPLPASDKHGADQ